MDYVYIYKNSDTEELKYSIRSVVSNMPNGRIWIIGDKPDWYVGNFIEVPQTKTKTINAKNNLQAICGSPQISEDIVLMNDDFFAINRVRKIKNFHGGFLAQKIEAYEDMFLGTNSYIEQLKRTHKRLLRLGIEKPLDYEIHVPMLMTKSGLKRALKGDTLWRSSYGNMFGIGGTEISDVKVYHSGPLIKKTYDINSLKYDYISTDDSSFEMVKEALLKDLFPEPSIYELISKN